MALHGVLRFVVEALRGTGFPGAAHESSRCKVTDRPRLAAHGELARYCA